MGDVHTQELIHTQQYYHWLHYRANRLKAAAALQQEQAPQDMAH
jgi:hypothetical protein